MVKDLFDSIIRKVHCFMKGSFEEQTDLRFISKGDTAFKIHIHLPDDTVVHRSVGFVRIGEKNALKKAIRLRDSIGKKSWGSHWHKILLDPDVFLRLPHSLEPTLIMKHKPTIDEPDRKIPYYIAKWCISHENGKRKYKSMLASVERYGKLGAYNRAKRALMEAHRDILPILTRLERFNIVKLK